MRIINIVDSVSIVNYGLWHSTIVNASLLVRDGHKVELWYPGDEKLELQDVICVPLPQTSMAHLERLFNDKSLDARSDVVITHGAWQYATRWGAWLKKRGFRWIYVPHGMLEPWPLKQKWLKKKIYFLFFENRLVHKADLIRAVSRPELSNLVKRFPGCRIEFIPNGVKVDRLAQKAGNSGNNKKRFLFLSRLHHKKNIVALLEAWVGSSLNHDTTVELVFAGPDQGELKNIQAATVRSSNIQYAGVVFGDDKQKLINSSTFFILPSFSEGLPSALLEGMAAGLIPIITAGCNLPDVFDLDLGIRIDTDSLSIKSGIETAHSWEDNLVAKKRTANYDFISRNYSLEALTKSQKAIYFPE